MSLSNLVSLQYIISCWPFDRKARGRTDTQGDQLIILWKTFSKLHSFKTLILNALWQWLFECSAFWHWPKLFYFCSCYDSNSITSSMIFNFKVQIYLANSSSGKLFLYSGDLNSKILICYPIQGYFLGVLTLLVPEGCYFQHSWCFYTSTMSEMMYLILASCSGSQ